MRLRETERRNLVGRRLEDYLRHGIPLQLSREERLLRAIFQDPRYRTRLDRRKQIRRAEERAEQDKPPWFAPQSAAFLFARLKDLL